MRLLLAVAGAVILLAVGAGSASAAVTAKVQGGVLQVAGDTNPNKILLEPDAGNVNAVDIDVGEDGTVDFAFDRSTFTSINVTGNGGNDDLRVSNALSDGVTLDGGFNDDTLSGGSGADLLKGGPGNDTVDGNRGNDVAFLDSGNDSFVWDPGDGSDTVEGGTGNDILDFNGANVAEQLGVSANGGRVRFTRDVGNVVMDLDDVEHLAVRALGGADTVTVGDLTGTDLKLADLDISSGVGGGDGAADTVIAQGTAGADHVSVGTTGGTTSVSGLAAKTQVTGGEAANDVLDVTTLAGTDTIAGNVGVSGLLAVNVDGGDDSDSGTYQGTGGDDTIGMAANGTAAAVFGAGSTPMDFTAVESLTVQGFAGNDTVTGANGLATLTSLVIDGGFGNDTLGGGDGSDTILGGPGNDVVDGNRGNDLALLGDGNDTFQWDPGDGSDTVEGQSGVGDSFAFNGANVNEKLAVSANGGRVRFTRDVGNVTTDLNDVEGIVERIRGGTDDVTVNDMAGTDLRQVDVDLSAIGGGGGGDGAADTVHVEGTAGADHVSVSTTGGATSVSGLTTRTSVSGGETGSDVLDLDTLAGADSVTGHVGLAGLAAVNVDGGDAADTGIYQGTNGADTISVLANGTAAAVAPPAGTPMNFMTETLDVQGLSGDDVITGSNGLATLTSLTIDGGIGEDQITGGDGSDRLIGGISNDIVVGGRGNDLALMGDGNDRFVWNPGDGSDTVEGQSAAGDELDINGANVNEKLAVSANGARVRFTRDVGSVTTDMAGIEHLVVRASGGTDTFTVNDLSGTELKTVDAHLEAAGGGGDGAADVVQVEGTNNPDNVVAAVVGSQVNVTGLAAKTQIFGSEPANDTLRIETLDGKDVVRLGAGVTSLIQVVVDLGAGQ